VVTAGDHFAELVAAEGLGVVVEAGNVDQLTAALERVLFDEEFIAAARANIHRVRERYYWETALGPLVTFVKSAHQAGDRAGVARQQTLGRKRRKRYSGSMHDLERVLFYLKNAGPKVVVAKIRRRMRRL
jgi:hypothetical protein